MRLMMMVIPEGYESDAPDAVPSAKAVAKMMECMSPCRHP